MKGHQLLELEKQGMEAMQQKNYSVAINAFQKLISLQPNWEHGAAQYHLACCFEDSGDIESARLFYLNAISLDSSNPYWVGGFSSFLYLHGEAQEAFDWYLKLIALETTTGNRTIVQKVKPAMTILGKRLGLTSDLLDVLIDRASRTA